MQINQNLIDLTIYISLIISAPGMFKLGQVITRYAINRFIPLDEIVIHYRQDGETISTKKIRATGYLIDQLKDSNNGANHERI